MINFVIGWALCLISLFIGFRMGKTFEKGEDA